MLIKELFRKIYYFKIYFRLKSKGKNIRLSKGGNINRPEELSIGSNVFIAKDFQISARNMYIGNNVMIGPFFLAECDDHVFDKVGISLYENRKQRRISGIIIENDVWIGGHVTLLKGVKIAEGCIIGAGSVVTKSCIPYTINFGNPCKLYKSRFSVENLEIHLQKVDSIYSLNEIILMWKQNKII